MGHSMSARAEDEATAASSTRVCKPPVPGTSAHKRGDEPAAAYAPVYTEICTLRKSELPSSGGSSPLYSARKPSARTKPTSVRSAPPR